MRVLNVPVMKYVRFKCARFKYACLKCARFKYVHLNVRVLKVRVLNINLLILSSSNISNHWPIFFLQMKENTPIHIYNLQRQLKRLYQQMETNSKGL